MRQRTKRPPPEYYDNDDKTCRWCGTELVGRQTRFCKPECEVEYWSRRNWTMLKRYVHKRDNWTCALCGDRHSGGQGLIHADHIVPIADGGDEFDPENVRTLCVDCHKAVTKEWRQKKAMKTTEGIETS